MSKHFLFYIKLHWRPSNFIQLLFTQTFYILKAFYFHPLGSTSESESDSSANQTPAQQVPSHAAPQSSTGFFKRIEFLTPLKDQVRIICNKKKLFTFQRNTYFFVTFLFNLSYRWNIKTQKNIKKQKKNNNLEIAFKSTQIYFFIEIWSLYLPHWKIRLFEISFYKNFKQLLVWNGYNCFIFLKELFIVIKWFIVSHVAIMGIFTNSGLGHFLFYQSV